MLGRSPPCPVREAAIATHGEVIEALVANRLTSPAPLLRVAEWEVPEVFGVAAETLNDDRVGRALDAIADPNIQRRGTKEPGKKQPVPLGFRCIVEATNSWWSNYGQLRRNTDRKPRHPHAALCLATTVLIIGKLLTYRDRWSPA